MTSSTVTADYPVTEGIEIVDRIVDNEKPADQGGNVSFWCHRFWCHSYFHGDWTPGSWTVKTKTPYGTMKVLPVKIVTAAVGILVVSAVHTCIVQAG